MLRYGIVGCGMMGQEHVRNIHLLDDTAVTFICEPDESMGDQCSKLAPKAKIVTTIESMPFEELDCLVIASPNYMHLDHFRSISQHAQLPLLIEKPLATTLEQISQVRETGRSYTAPVWVAMEYRYMPPVARFIQQVQATTGGVRMLTIREHRYPFLQKVNDWNRFNQFSGGTLVEKCCHFFDLMRLIINSEPVSVMASGGQALNHLDEQYELGVPDIWDNAYVIVTFANGSRAMLELCMFAEGSMYQEEISAVGPAGKLECQVPGPARFWPEHLGQQPPSQLVYSPREPAGCTVETIEVDPLLQSAGDHHGSTFYQHQKFQQVVLGAATPEVTLRDGWMAVVMGMAAQESAVTNQTVTVDPDLQGS